MKLWHKSAVAVACTQDLPIGRGLPRYSFTQTSLMVARLPACSRFGEGRQLNVTFLFLQHHPPLLHCPLIQWDFEDPVHDIWNIHLFKKRIIYFGKYEYEKVVFFS